MLFLFSRCLLSVIVSMTKALNGQNCPKQNFHPPPPVNAAWKTLLQLMLFFLSLSPFFHFRLLINRFPLIDSKLLGINQMKLLM